MSLKTHCIKKGGGVYEESHLFTCLSLYLAGRRIQRDGKIPGAISIDLRPKVVGRRKQVGHWETDNIIGKTTDMTPLSTTVERIVKVTHLTKIARTAQAKTTALTNHFSQYLDELKQTITIDNGGKNVTFPTIGLPV